MSTKVYLKRPSSRNPYADVKKISPPFVPHRLGWVRTSKDEFDLARECGVPEEVAKDKTLLNLYRDLLNKKTVQLTDDENRVYKCYGRSLERYNDAIKKGKKAKLFIHTPPEIYTRARTAGFPHFLATNYYLLERLYLGLPREDEREWIKDYKIAIQNFREAGGVQMASPTSDEPMMIPMNLEQMFSDCDSFGTSPTSSFDGMLNRMSSDSSDPSSDF